MPIVFESISDGFYTAFFEPDSGKRKGEIDAWIKESSRVIQSAVERELRELIEDILKETWTQTGWKSRAQKFCNSSFIDTYKLYMDINVGQRTPNNKDKIVGPLTPEVRTMTNEAAEVAKIAIAKLEPPPPIGLREIDLHGNTVNKAIHRCFTQNLHESKDMKAYPILNKISRFGYNITDKSVNEPFSYPELPVLN
jgi:hypothetical protein